MGRLDKLKREMITEANRKLLNEIVDISIAEPEMDNTTVSMGSNEGLLLECVKIDELNPKNSEFSYAGPYPWDLVKYNKESRPVEIYLYRNKPRDVVWGGSDDHEMVLHFEEITDSVLRKFLGITKKYIMATNGTPGVIGSQYCRVDRSMDKYWDENLFNYQSNGSLIEPNPDFSQFKK